MRLQVFVLPERVHGPRELPEARAAAPGHLQLQLQPVWEGLRQQERTAGPHGQPAQARVVDVPVSAVWAQVSALGLREKTYES